MSERTLTRAILFWLNNQPDIWCMKTLGGPLQRHGVPDILGCANGHFFAMEVKDNGGTASAIQRIELERIAVAGGRACVVRSVEEVKGIVEILRQRKK